jgi:hypothetical protein
MKSIAVALPPWVDEKRKELVYSPQPSLYFTLGPLLQWQDIDVMFTELANYAAGSGVKLQITELVKELKDLCSPQTLVARLSVSNILREQFILHVAAAEQLGTTLYAYVIRLSPQGSIMGIRATHLYPN